jgi:hypothetical protein
MEIHSKQFQRISEFDLTQFKNLEEINYLETDYGFDLLALADCILSYMFKSEVCARLLKD